MFHSCRKSSGIVSHSHSEGTQKIGLLSYRRPRHDSNLNGEITAYILWQSPLKTNHCLFNTKSYGESRLANESKYKFKPCKHQFVSMLVVMVCLPSDPAKSSSLWGFKVMQILWKGIIHPKLKFHPVDGDSGEYFIMHLTFTKGKNFTQCQNNGSPWWPYTQT